MLGILFNIGISMAIITKVYTHYTHPLYDIYLIILLELRLQILRSLALHCLERTVGTHFICGARLLLKTVKIRMITHPRTRNIGWCSQTFPLLRVGSRHPKPQYLFLIFINETMRRKKFTYDVRKQSSQSNQNFSIGN